MPRLSLVFTALMTCQAQALPEALSPSVDILVELTRLTRPSPTATVHLTVWVLMQHAGAKGSVGAGSVELAHLSVGEQAHLFWENCAGAGSVKRLPWRLGVTWLTACCLCAGCSFGEPRRSTAEQSPQPMGFLSEIPSLVLV